jgi:4Fe-4S binding domain.
MKFIKIMGKNIINQIPYDNGFGTSSINEYKESYIPVEYNPFPEWLVYSDVILLGILLIIGIWLLYKGKGHRYFGALMLTSLLYFGFFRGGCICPAGSLTNIVHGILDPQSIGLMTFAVFMLPVIAALFFGRVFCSSGCPLGSVQDFMYKKKGKFIKLPLLLNNMLSILPVFFLIATVYTAVSGTCHLVCKIEPYKALFFTGESWIKQAISLIGGTGVEYKLLYSFGLFTWIYLAVILVLGYYVPRPFCRFVCPYGVVLGLVSMLSFRKRRIETEKCIRCGLCSKHCPVQAITLERGENGKAEVSSYKCIQCGRCTEVCRKNSIK